jgi:hypothetical protein
VAVPEGVVGDPEEALDFDPPPQAVRPRIAVSATATTSAARRRGGVGMFRKMPRFAGASNRRHAVRATEHLLSGR